MWRVCQPSGASGTSHGRPWHMPILSPRRGQERKRATAIWRLPAYSMNDWSPWLARWPHVRSHQAGFQLPPCQEAGTGRHLLSAIPAAGKSPRDATCRSRKSLPAAYHLATYGGTSSRRSEPTGSKSRKRLRRTTTRTTIHSRHPSNPVLPSASGCWSAEAC